MSSERDGASHDEVPMSIDDHGPPHDGVRILSDRILQSHLDKRQDDNSDDDDDDDDEEEDGVIEIYEIIPNEEDNEQDETEDPNNGPNLGRFPILQGTDDNADPIDGEFPPVDDQKAFYQRLILQITANPVARDKANPFARRFLEIAVRHHLIERPIERYTAGLKSLKRTHSAGGYARLVAGKLQKIGEFGDEIVRLQYYEEEGYHPDCIKRLWDLDLMPKPAGEEFEIVYQEYVTAMSSSPELPTFTRILFQQLGEQKGDRLGPKRTIWNTLLEQGLCLEYGLGNPFQHLMFQQEVADTWYRLATEYSTKAALEGLAEIMKRAKLVNTDTRNEVARGFLHALMSWKPNIDGLSTKLVATLGIVRDPSKLSDPIDFPAIADAKTTEDRYDTTHYTALHKGDGRQHVHEIIVMLLAAPFGIVFLDTNRIIFAEDENFDGNVYDFLRETFGLTEVQCILFGEIRIFSDRAELHAVVVHGPLCVSTDPRQALIVKVRRSLTEAILNNIGRMFRGEALLAEDMDEFNPINGALCFQVYRYGLHQGARQASTAKRNLSADKETNAFVVNGLAKTTTSNFPVAQNLRDDINRNRPPVSRPLNKHVVLQGRRLVSKMTEENAPVIYQTLMGLFEGNNATPRCKTARWRLLMKNHIRPESELHAKLTQLRTAANDESANSNLGNRTVGLGRGNKPCHTRENNEELAVILAKHGPNGTQPGSRFWIKGNRKSVRPKNNTMCNDGVTEFPGKYNDVYDSMVYSTFRDRLSGRSTSKENTRQINVEHRRTTASGIGVERVKYYSNTDYIIAGPEDAGYFLIELLPEKKSKATKAAPKKKAPKKKAPPKSKVSKPPRFCRNHNALLPREQFRPVRTNLCIVCEEEDANNVKAGTHKHCTFGKHVVAIDQFKDPQNTNCDACIVRSAQQKRDRKEGN